MKFLEKPAKTKGEFPEDYIYIVHHGHKCKPPVVSIPLRVPDQVSDQSQECDKDGDHIWHMDERHRLAER